MMEFAFPITDDDGESKGWGVDIEDALAALQTQSTGTEALDEAFVMGWDAHAEREDFYAAREGMRAALQQSRSTPVPVDAGGASALPDNLIDIIEQELEGWKGLNGGIYTIRAAASGVAIKLRAALHAAPAPAVGDGFVVVPVEPTEAMLRAAMKAGLEAHPYASSEHWFRVGWKAMLSAASGEPVGEKGRG